LISIISCFNISNILSADGQTSFLPSDFDITLFNKVVNTTSIRGMVDGSITNNCLNGGIDNDILYVI